MAGYNREAERAIKATIYEEALSRLRKDLTWQKTFDQYAAEYKAIFDKYSIIEGPKIEGLKIGNSIKINLPTEFTLKSKFIIEQMQREELERNKQEEAATKIISSMDFIVTSDDEGEMKVIVEDKPVKRIDEMTFADYQRGCAKVMK